MLRQALSLMRRVGLDYSCFRIFSVSLTDGSHRAGIRGPAGYRIAELGIEDLDRSPHDELRSCRDYLGGEARVFGVYDPQDALVCVQCIWYGERYRRARFWPLGRRDAASMHLVSVASERCKGLATWLKQETADRMQQSGFARIYSRVWWTNQASRRVSEKAGWEHVGTVLELKIWGRPKPLRIIRRVRRMPQFADTFTSPISVSRINLR